MRQPSEPIFNVPGVVTATIAVLCLVHVAFEYLLPTSLAARLSWTFAFVPARYDSTPLSYGAYPGGFGAAIWTFVTYAALHGSWMHLGFNAAWLLAFGTPIARRFGALRFLLFFAVTAAGGALAHLAVYSGSETRMIGASAAISGFMAAAIRFAFQRGGPLRLIGSHQDDAYRVPAPPLLAVLREPRALIFLAAWFGLNLLFGLGSFGIDDTEQSVAWEAHVGGFLAGLIGFAAFDPIKPARPRDGGGPDPAGTIH